MGAITQDKADPNRFKVASATRKGTFYEVDIKNDTCTCPAFKFHGGTHGRGCKHIDEVRKEHQVTSTGRPSIGADTKRQVLEYLKQRGSEEIIFLMERFGDDVIHELLAENAIIEEHGTVRPL